MMMHRRILSLALMTLGLGAPAQPAETPWMVNPEEIVPASADHPVLIFFSGTDRHSRRMATWTLSSPAVVEALRDVTPAWVEVNRRPALVERFDVGSAPAVVLVGRDGAILGQHEGLLEREAFLQWLRSGLALVPLTPPPPPVAAASPETASIADTLDSAVAPGAAAPRDGVRASEIEIRLRAVTSATAGRDLPMQVFVPGGADSVVLRHRSPREGAYRDVRMSPNTPTIFYGVIPGEAITPEGVEYYISVTRGGQTVTHPLEGPGAPHRIAVR